MSVSKERLLKYSKTIYQTIGHTAAKYSPCGLFGDHIRKVPPVPIPNTVVKLSEPMIVPTSVKVGIAEFLKTLVSLRTSEGFFVFIFWPPQNLWVDSYWFLVTFQGWHNLDVFAHAETRARDFFNCPLNRWDRLRFWVVDLVKDPCRRIFNKIHYT